MDTKSPLFKYKIGLIVLGVLAAALVIFLLVQANTSRQDTKTYKAAVEIAEKLNAHILEKDKIPASLDEAGIATPPSTIVYKKLSNEKYRFCVTYKADSSGLDASSAVTQTVYGSSYDYDYDDSDSYNDSELYISSTYKKGERCQTIEPYLNSYDRGSSWDVEEDSQESQTSDDLSGPYATCGQSHNYSWTSLQITSINASTISVFSTPESTFLVDTNVKVFDANCSLIDYSDLQVGDTVGLYFNPYGSPVTMIILAY